MRIIALLLVALLPCSTFATVRETITTIDRINALLQYGGGDIVIDVDTPVSGCTKGFWMSPSDDPGFKTAYALLLSAYHTQTSVRLQGEDTQLWSGSGSLYCRLTLATLL
ncbi:hypothetical protein [Peristeroidobacter soli]|jgi:hypothetical protein|uniref:hypothetical protein n=1 Tax=Peristeroidobacter soli TaxID=2497877 RepID=UPI00101B5E81|nr:hypothetical protein [Peristeroidobacter soli]